MNPSDYIINKVRHLGACDIYMGLTKDTSTWVLAFVDGTPEKDAEEAYSLISTINYAAIEENLPKIAALEASITDRRRDEAILGIDSGWLLYTRNQITALRENLLKAMGNDGLQ